MKKIILTAAVAALAALSLAACDTGAQSGSSTPDTAYTTSGSESSQTVSVLESYDNTFDGFVQYMSDYGYIKGDGAELTASAIGAKQGLRYTMSSGTAKCYVELYEYDTNDISDTASKTISEARASGTFTLIDSTSSATQYTKAAVTSDGRFLMLYTDNSTNDGSVEKKENAAIAVEEFNK